MSGEVHTWIGCDSCVNWKHKACIPSNVDTSRLDDDNAVFVFVCPECM